jgi:Cu(I)/Ag(I) efflux system membrane fusion protein
MLYRSCCLAILFCFVAGATQAQSIRDRTRPTYDTGTKVTESQAEHLTLTLSDVAQRSVQTWLRTGATIDPGRRILSAEIHPSEAKLVTVGQRVRAFPPDAKSSMYQAKVTRVIPQGSRVKVEATLSGPGRENSTYYVMEIVVERGFLLSVANEAIIEEGEKRIAYVQRQPGQYEPREIHLGVQGELYTQVLHGLSEGDQVVTIGSFFIDSERKLKAPGQPATSNGHQHH